MGGKKHFAKLKKGKIHVTGLANGCLWRSCGRSGQQYRKNGKTYLEGHKGALRKYYDHDFTNHQSKAGKRFNGIMKSKKYGKKSKDPRFTKNLWHIGAHGNFSTGKKPWVNNAHHILPCAVLRDAFTSKELTILLKGKYNLNVGENIVWLPKKTLDGQLMEMVTHPGSHPTYSAKVQGLIGSKIKPKIKKANDPNSDDHAPLDEKDIPKLRDVINKETEKIMMNTLKYGKIGMGVTVDDFDPAWTQ